MLKPEIARRTLHAALFTLVLVTAAPAGAGVVYVWQTEDGTHAFADALKNVPLRYREGVEVRRSKDLTGYKQLTPNDTAATERYAASLTERLRELRARNAARVGHADGPVRAARPTVQLRTGGDSSPTLELTPASGDAPVVVESIHTRKSNSPVTRLSTVVRQGDRTLLVVHPRSRETNVSTDIHDEATLVR